MKAISHNLAKEC